MITGRKLFLALLALCCLAVPSHLNLVTTESHADVASTCHDNSWDAGEYCGHDAVKITGVEDMNHDCVVDGLDLCLFTVEYGNGTVTGPSLSGDCKSSGFPGPAPCGGVLLCPDGKLNLSDISFFFTMFGQTASPCTAVPIPSVCDGKISLSFNSSSIVNNATQATGAHTAYVLVDNLVSARAVEYTIQTSPNITIIDHQPVIPPGSLGGSPPACGIGSMMIGTSVAVSGLTTIATIQYVLNDTKPATMTLVKGGCPWLGLRWCDATAALSHNFLTITNAGINGSTPANTPSACTPVGQISGRVYSDKNTNCVYDSGTDDPVANLTVQATPGPYFALTDASGNYTLTVPVGAYTVKMVPAANDPWKKLNTCQAATYSVTVTANGSYPGKDFALQPLAKITGLVYRDFTAFTACVKDVADPPIESRMMVTTPGSYIGYTDKNGNYALNVPAGTYLVSNYPISGDPWGLRSCQAATYSVTVAANATATGKDFALELVDTSKPCDVSLNIISNGFNIGPSPCTVPYRHPCPGVEHEYLITVGENVLSGTDLGTGVELDIVLDPTFTISTVTSDCAINIVSSPSANERVVAITSHIYPGNTCVVAVRATPATAGPYTNTVTLDDGGIGCTGTLVRTLQEVSSCSCDPNDMWVQPGCGPDGEVAQGAPLTYTVHFENVGTGPAHNIFIEDVLDEDLDLSSVTIVSSSHPVTGKQVNPNNKLVISLEGVDLAGTLGPGSNRGYVMFTVRPLPVDEQFDGYIENSAAIIFDFNEPVITNTVITTLVDDPCVATGMDQEPLPLANYLGSNYPNPFNPTTTITYALSARSRVTVAIFDISGKLVRTLVSDDRPAGWYTVNWDGRDQGGNPVASGVYFSQMRAGSFTASNKLVLLK